MSKTLDLVMAVPISKTKIAVTFEDGTTGVIDLLKLLNETPDLYKPILSNEKTMRFTIKYGSLAWLEDDLDVAPELLFSVLEDKETL